MTVFLSALVTSTLAVAMLLPVLRRREILDRPNARSSHCVPVPRGGGVAVLAAVVFASCIASLGGRDPAWSVVGIAVALAAVGFADDVRTLGTGARLAFQLVAAGLVAAWAASLDDDLPLELVPFVLIAVVGVVGYVNAFNFMDGINGISALNTAAAGAWYAFLGYHYGVDELAVLGTAAAGAVLGFLPWNAPTARIFLGDVGSYGLGLLISAMAVLSWVSDAGALVSVAPLVIYGVDTSWALIKRAAGGRSITEAHREHGYQRLVDAGWEHLTAGAVTVTAAVACIAISWWFSERPLLAGLLILLTAGAYVGLPRLNIRTADVSS